MYLFEVNLIKQIAAIFSFQFSTRETKTGFLCKIILLFWLWVIFWLARWRSGIDIPTPARSTKERNVSLNSFFISSRGARSRGVSRWSISSDWKHFELNRQLPFDVLRVEHGNRWRTLQKWLKAQAPGIKYLIRFKLNSQERNCLLTWRQLTMAACRSII